MYACDTVYFNVHYSTIAACEGSRFRRDRRASWRHMQLHVRMVRRFVMPKTIPAHEVTRSTHVFSSFFTSALKSSTSCQQSSGRLSFSRRH